jgi:hypothetical protein
MCHDKIVLSLHRPIIQHICANKIGDATSYAIGQLANNLSPKLVSRVKRTLFLHPIRTEMTGTYHLML